MTRPSYLRLADQATGWRLLALVCAYAFIAVVLQRAEEDIRAVSAGLGVPDLMRFATPQALEDRLAALGETGRALYFRAEFVDLLYPLVYSCLFASVLALSLRRVWGRDTPLLRVVLLPFVAAVADYGENLGLFTMLFAWPDPPGWASVLASAGNNAKWALAIVVIALSAVAAIAALAMGPRRGWGKAP